jgi:YD repeat-containing protein
MGDLDTRHEYNAFGDLFQTTLPAGNVVEYLYDYDLEDPPPVTSLGVGRLRVIERKPNISTAGQRAVYSYDVMGNRTFEELQEADTTVRSSTEFVYAGGGCLLEKVKRSSATPEEPGPPEESVTEYDYDCSGNLTDVWDANFPRGAHPVAPTRYAYDELDRLTLVRQTWGGSQGAVTACNNESTTDAVTCYGYDVQDHLTSVTDAERNQTTYEYSDRDLRAR